MSELELRSPAFDDGERIPRRHGYDAANTNPPLRIAGVPEAAESLALVVDDPDAEPVAGKVWDHWTVWNVAPDRAEISEDWNPTEDGAREGTNDFEETGYGGPKPPDGEHTYRFTLYALDTDLGVEAGATKADVERAMEGHVLAEATLRGTYAPA